MAIARRILSALSALADRVFQEGLDTSEYEARLEREFNITLPAKAASQLKTLGDLCRLIADERKRMGSPLNDDEIWIHVRGISSEELGVDPSELHTDLRFVEDLCF
jgi:acyl carrier protein